MIEKIFIPILYTVLLYIYWKYKSQRGVFCDLLYILYIALGICGILYYVSGESYRMYYYSISYTPLFYLLFVLLFWIEPFGKIKDTSLSYVRITVINSHSLIRICSIIFLPFAFFLLINVSNVFNLADISMLRAEQDYESYLQYGSFFRLSLMFSYLSFVPHFLFFYSLDKGIRPIYTWLLLFDSLIFAFGTLCMAGRDGIIFWVFETFIFYSIFKNNFDANYLKKLKIGIAVIVMPLMFVFIFISTSRFLLEGNNNVLELYFPFLGYFGDQIHNFCQSYYLDGSALPSTNRLTYTFGTFVKSLYWKHGELRTILISIGFALGTKYLVYLYNRSNTIWLFFMLIILYQIPLFGVFYYRHALGEMGIINIVFFVFCGIMHFISPKEIYDGQL